MKFFLALVLLLSSLLTPKSLADSRIELVEEKTILISGVINGRMVRPTIDTMDKLAGGKQIDMIFSSPGGSVIAGSLIIDRMEQLKLDGVRFRCVVRDLAASMAFQILLHCDERYATPNAFLLWHPVRIFLQQEAVTADIADVLHRQLKQADELVLHDLIAYLPMKKKDLMWHFKNETLHQAFNLTQSAPGFFKKVTNNIGGLRPKKPALDTADLISIFGLNQVVYIHERFLGVKK